MSHYIVEPEVAGGLGVNTVLDRSRHPPVVEALHYEIEGWLGDVLLESFPAYIVTEEAQQALARGGVTGARFDAVEISTGDQFKESNPGVILPCFVWLRPEGEGGRDDIATAADGRLILSQRALDVLCGLSNAQGNGHGLSNALIEPFPV